MFEVHPVDMLLHGVFGCEADDGPEKKQGSVSLDGIYFQFDLFRKVLGTSK